MADVIDQLLDQLRPSPYTNEPNRQDNSTVPQEMPGGPGNPQPVGWIDDGVIIAPNFDTTPPAVPTGLALNSLVLVDVDGTSFVNLIASLTQPADADLFGSYVQVTGRDAGGGTPDWTDPAEVLIGQGTSQATIHNVLAVHQYWARARSVDVLGNFSAFTSTVTHTTVGDTTPPPTPTTLTLIPGFQGFAAVWTGGDVADLSHYELRWAQAASPPDGDDGAWLYAQIRASTHFVPDLTADLLYWAEVRGADTSGNVSAWTAGVSVTPTNIGSDDIAANSISAAAGHIADLNADDIEAGTIRIRDATGFADGLLVYGPLSDTVPVIEINAPTDEGIIRFRNPSNENEQLLIEAGEIKFTEDGGVTAPITALNKDGLNASAVRFGDASGGHNLIFNSSFELSGYAAASTVVTFTDTTQWKAADGTLGRVTAVDNITEGTTLTATTLAF